LPGVLYIVERFYLSIDEKDYPVFLVLFRRASQHVKKISY